MIIPPFKKGIPINKVNLVCHIPKVQVDTVFECTVESCTSNPAVQISRLP